MLRDLLPFIIVGLVTGSLYGLTALGLVLTYKTSGIFNFAHGALATIAAYTFYVLTEAGLPWPVAMFCSVVLLGVGLGFALERLAAALASVSPAFQVVATVGLLIAVQAAAGAIFGAETRTVDPYLPTDNISLGGVNVGVDQLIIVFVALAGACGLFAFFRSTSLGLSMQAVVDDPALLAMGGRNPVRVRRVAWIIGAGFACLSGVLLVPTTGLDATILTLLVVQAFGAAAVGFFSSLPLTYLGGLGIGVIAAVSTRFIGDVPALAGFPSAVPFLVLFAVLVFAPRRRLLDIGSQLRLRATPPPTFRPSTRALVGGGTLGLLVLMPALVGTRLPVYTSGLIFVVIFLSLYLLIRTSGQVSLAHASFAAVGAAAFSKLATSGVPWGLALLGAGLITVPVGAVVAIPAIRLSGLFLAVATFGFGILLERLVYPTSLMFGPASVEAPRPSGLEGDAAYYYIVLGVAVASAVLTILVIRGRLGRLLRAMSDSPTALSTLGTSVNSTRVMVFCISAFMAGIAGALFGALTQSINGDSFSFFASLTWLAVFAISGAPFRYAPLPTAVLAGINLAVIPSYLHSEALLDYLPVVFGVAAIANALLTDRGHGSKPAAEEPVTTPPAAPVDGRRGGDRGRERSPVGARMEPVGRP